MRGRAGRMIGEGRGRAHLQVLKVVPEILYAELHTVSGSSPLSAASPALTLLHALSGAYGPTSGWSPTLPAKVVRQSSVACAEAIKSATRAREGIVDERKRREHACRGFDALSWL